VRAYGISRERHKTTECSARDPQPLDQQRQRNSGAPSGQVLPTGKDEKGAIVPRARRRVSDFKDNTLLGSNVLRSQPNQDSRRVGVALTMSHTLFLVSSKCWWKPFYPPGLEESDRGPFTRTRTGLLRSRSRSSRRRWCWQSSTTPGRYRVRCSRCRRRYRTTPAAGMEGTSMGLSVVDDAISRHSIQRTRLSTPRTDCFEGWAKHHDVLYWLPSTTTFCGRRQVAVCEWSEEHRCFGPVAGGFPRVVRSAPSGTVHGASKKQIAGSRWPKSDRFLEFLPDRCLCVENNPRPPVVDLTEIYILSYVSRPKIRVKSHAAPQTVCHVYGEMMFKQNKSPPASGWQETCALRCSLQR